MGRMIRRTNHIRGEISGPVECVPSNFLVAVSANSHTQTGGRDTAGLGGRGGFKRLFANQEIKQTPDSLKEDVPEHIRENARRMAREELARRLEELNLSTSDAAMYGRLLSSVQSHVAQLHDLLESTCYIPQVDPYLLPRHVQTSRRRKKNEFGSNVKLTESLISADSLTVSQERLRSIRGEGWPSLTQDVHR